MNMGKRSRKLLSNEGFGLVELIVVVAIIGVLTLVAIPVYGAIQDTAKQNTASEAALSAYGSLTSVYKNEGRTATLAAIKKLNSGDQQILYYVRETPLNSDGTMKSNPGHKPDTRAFLEQAAKNPNSGLTVPLLRSAIDDVTLGENISNASQANPNGTGDYLCVSAIIGKQKIEAIGWAGLACGPPAA